MWWWGQAQGFAEQDACVAFAGSEVSAGPFRTKVTALVVRLPDGTLLRLGNPGTSPVRAMITDDSWVLIGRTRFWQVELRAMRKWPTRSSCRCPWRNAGPRRARWSTWTPR